MLCRDIVSVDCDNHAMWTEALCEQHTNFILLQRICIHKTVIYKSAIGKYLCCLSPISQPNHIWRLYLQMPLFNISVSFYENGWIVQHGIEGGCDLR
jgi:hypothetical protein